MGNLDKFNYECEGQIEMSEYLAQQVNHGTVDDLTSWICSQGKSQYAQIGDVIKTAFEEYKDDPNIVDRITNVVSIYVLQMSSGYMKYLKEKSEV